MRITIASGGLAAGNIELGSTGWDLGISMYGGALGAQSMTIGALGSGDEGPDFWLEGSVQATISGQVNLNSGFIDVGFFSDEYLLNPVSPGGGLTCGGLSVLDGVLTSGLTVNDGGTVTVNGQALFDGAHSDATGEGSLLKVSGTLTISAANAASLSANDGAQISAQSIAIGKLGELSAADDAVVEASQNVMLQGGALDVAAKGDVAIGGEAAGGADELVVAAGGVLQGQGAVSSPTTGETPVAQTTTPTYALNIGNEGKIEAKGGALTLDGNVSGDGQFLVGDDSTLKFGGKVDDDVTVMFLPGHDETITIDDPEDFKGVISSENLEPGDKIDLPNVPYINPGSADLNPDGASFYFETGEQQPNYMLQVVEDDKNYDIPISEDDDNPLTGGFTLSDDGSGGTLVSYTYEAVTDYSVTATADGPKTGPYGGIVKIVYDTSKTGDYSTGSGFAVASDVILTAYHVVADAPVINGQQVVTVYLSNGAKTIGYVKNHGTKNFFGVKLPSNAPTATSGDWAYVVVPPGTFSSTKLFTPDYVFSGGEVNVSGYPAAGNNISTVYEYDKFGSLLVPSARVSSMARALLLW